MNWHELMKQTVSLIASGKYDEAMPVAEQAVSVAQSTFGKEDPRVAAALNNLTVLYFNLGRYREAEPFASQARLIQEKASAQDTPEYARSLNNLGIIYGHEGFYAKAEPILFTASEVCLKTLGPSHPDLAAILSNLAGVIHEQGKDPEELYKKALAIRQKSLRPDDPQIAQSMHNLAAFYMEVERYSEAEPLLRQALVLLQKTLSPNNPKLAIALNDLAELYQDQKKYTQAEIFFKQALAISQGSARPDDAVIAVYLDNLGSLYRLEGQYRKAEPLLQEALAISQKTLGQDSPGVKAKLSNLARLYYSWGRPSRAQKYFDLVFENLMLQFEKQLAYAGETGRLGLLGAVSDEIAAYLSFASMYHNQDPQIATRTYDLLLWEKGLVANSQATQRARLLASGDAEAIHLFDQLSARKTQLAALASVTPQALQHLNAASLKTAVEVDDLEEQLARRSTGFADSQRLARPSWRDVQKVLDKRQAAVEIIRFQFVDRRQWTGEAKYVALVLTPTMKNGPVLIDLGYSTALEGELQAAYYRRVAPPGGIANLSGGECSATVRASAPSVGHGTAEITDQLAFYNSFWKPLEPALGGATRIYISMDGMLNQVALGLIPTSQDNALLMNKYDLRFLNRTADLLQRVPVHMQQSAVLFANPDFNLTEAGYRRSLASLGTSPLGSQAGGVIPQLSQDGTTLSRCTQLTQVRALEVGIANDIAPLFRESGWTVNTYFEEQALVEKVEQVQAPRVLHIATHGDFLPDPATKRPASFRPSDGPFPVVSDPMFRSRLFFAGANQTLGDHPLPSELSNGILTAYQASTLNLHGTELVVLSACDTGRGDVQDGEGVFGLRRAFQEAGAESLLMTLWEVPAIESQELLSRFYHHWISDSMDKHEALLAAQRDERDIVQRRYGSDLPYYWGAFILVGR